MYFKKKSYSAGFTIIELLIVISIMAILAGAISILAYGFYENRSLDSNFNQIVNALKSARIKSMQQDESSRWGIHFDNSDTASPFFAEFQGDSYIGGTTTKKTYLSRPVQFNSPAASTSADIIFERTSGFYSGSGTISISLKAYPAQTKNINISANGIEY